MPELPEVETVRRQLDPELSDRRVVEVGSHPSTKFTPARAVTEARFRSTGRRGKYLLVATEDGRELVVHLGMTGRLQVVDRPPDLDHPHLRAWWRLDDDRTMEFVDIRRFGRIRVVAAGDYRSIPTLATAGPEPFDPDFDGRSLHRAVARSRRRLKTQLLSQRPVAGLGNIYADEALWLAEINPRTTRLGLDRAEDLVRAIRTVLAQGLDNGGTTLRDYRRPDGTSGTNQDALAVYGRAGRPCLRCGEELRSESIDARTTTWCPRCQRR